MEGHLHRAQQKLHGIDNQKRPTDGFVSFIVAGDV